MKKKVSPDSNTGFPWVYKYLVLSSTVFSSVLLTLMSGRSITSISTLMIPPTIWSWYGVKFDRRTLDKIQNEVVKHNNYNTSKLMLFTLQKTSAPTLNVLDLLCSCSHLRNPVKVNALKKSKHKQRNPPQPGSWLALHRGSRHDALQLENFKTLNYQATYSQEQARNHQHEHIYTSSLDAANWGCSRKNKLMTSRQHKIHTFMSKGQFTETVV